MFVGTPGTSFPELSGYGISVRVILEGKGDSSVRHGGYDIRTLRTNFTLRFERLSDVGAPCAPPPTPIVQNNKSQDEARQPPKLTAVRRPKREKAKKNP